MILAAGLTPAWQQILQFDRFQTGEVNRAREAHWCASGKVVNVGIALAHLGRPTRMLCVTGGSVGEALRRDAESLGVSARWIDSAAETRVCTTILDASTGRTTELVENARPLTTDELATFFAAYQEEARSATVAVLTGSLPPGTPVTFYRDLIERSPAGLRIVLDARGPELEAALPLRPTVVKPNREELSRTFGRPLETETDLVGAMRALNARGAEWVVVSQGAGQLFATSVERTLRYSPPAVPVVNPIGCGDCLAAGIAWSLHAGMDVPDAIRFGMAASADNLSQLLPARLNPDRVARVAQTIVG